MNGVNMCTTCMARHFDPKKGIVCSTTGEKYTCEGHCQNYQKDVMKVQDDTYAHNRRKEIGMPLWVKIILTVLFIWALKYIIKMLTLGFISM